VTLDLTRKGKGKKKATRKGKGRRKEAHDKPCHPVWTVAAKGKGERGRKKGEREEKRGEKKLATPIYFYTVGQRRPGGKKESGEKKKEEGKRLRGKEKKRRKKRLQAALPLP